MRRQPARRARQLEAALGRASAARRISGSARWAGARLRQRPCSARHGERDRARLREARRTCRAPGHAGAPLRRRRRVGQRALDRSHAAPMPPRRVAARHPRRAARADAARAEGLGLHLGDAGRRRAAVVVHRVRGSGRRHHAARRQPVRLRGPCAALHPARLSEAQRAGPPECGGAPGRRVRAHAGRAHFRADHHAARIAGDRRAAPRRLRARRRRHPGPAAGPGTEAAAHAAVPGAAADVQVDAARRAAE